MPKRYYGKLALSVIGMLLGLPGLVLAQEAIMETENFPPSVDWTIECTVWHQVYPNYCNTAHQTNHVDNGDGVMSVCDFIWLDGVQNHITWIGPTYYVDYDGDYIPDAGWEPIEFMPGSPVCQTWLQVFPEYGALLHVDDWIDGNDDGIVNFCDTIFIGGQEGHVRETYLNIHVTEDIIPVEEGTWSKMKRLFFGGLF